MKIKTWKLIVIIFISILVIILAIAPRIAKNQLIKNSKEWVGRSVDIESVKLNYFTATLRISDFQMFEDDDSTLFVGFDSLILDVEPYQLLSSKIIIEEFALIGLQTNVIQHDTTFNFDDLIAFHSKVDTMVHIEEEIEEEDTTSLGYLIEVSNIRFHASSISYEDQSLEHTTELKNLYMNIPYISWNEHEQSQAGVQFDLNDKASLEVNFNYHQDSGNYETNVIIDNLDLSDYYVYAEQQLNITSLNGVFNTNLLVNGNVNFIEESQLSGNILLNDFQIDDLDEEKLFAVKTLDIELSSIDAFNLNFSIDSIRIVEPFVAFELRNDGTNFDKLIKVSEKDEVEVEFEEDSSNVDRPTELFYSIQSFNIENASVDFNDYTTQEPFIYHLSKINMKSENISSDMDWVVTYLDMLLNNRGIMDVEFGFNPNKPMDLDCDYVMTDFQLSDLNIYSKYHMGFPILYGEMFYFSNTTIRDGTIKSTNKLKINDVELGEKQSGFKSIPLKFALFLLKDKNGDINLDLPVNGDLNDPDINIGKIVWTTFKNVIVKVASSPVDFLSGFANVDPNDIKSIDFQYRDTTLSNHIEHQLDMLLKLERKKEGLKIQMVYFNDMDKEKESIAMQEIGKDYYKETHNDYEKDESGFVSFVRGLTAKDSVDLAYDCMKLIGVGKVDSLYTNYSNQRFDKVQSYLKLQNDSTNISIIPYNAKAPKNKGSQPVFEMKYSLEGE